ncbi:hypothetical protein BC830DRAFT_1077620 [Chytriomyces sp. MP71]|nr:hypothetical protein BC830DRAFT_1077620 [Chytriomyces sp. MP71]
MATIHAITLLGTTATHRHGPTIHRVDLVQVATCQRDEPGASLGIGLHLDLHNHVFIGNGFIEFDFESVKHFAAYLLTSRDPKATPNPAEDDKDGGNMCTHLSHRGGAGAYFANKLHKALNEKEMKWRETGALAFVFVLQQDVVFYRNYAKLSTLPTNVLADGEVVHNDGNGSTILIGRDIGRPWLGGKVARWSGRQVGHDRGRARDRMQVVAAACAGWDVNEMFVPGFPRKLAVMESNLRRTTLDRLPYELQIQIAKKLSPNHLAALSATCRQLRLLYHDATLWSHLLQRVFGRDRVQSESPEPSVGPVEDAAGLIALFQRLSSVVTVDKMNIVWGEDRRYWNLSEAVDGVSGIGFQHSTRLAQLNAVCYLDVKARLSRCVMAGVYTPQVRVHVIRSQGRAAPIRSLSNVHFVAKVLREPTEDDDPELGEDALVVAQSYLPLGTLLANHASASYPWTTVSLPSIRIDEEARQSMRTVVLSLEDHSNNWKMGLVVDAFLLTRVIKGESSHENDREMAVRERTLIGEAMEKVVKGASSLVSKGMGFLGL